MKETNDKKTIEKLREEITLKENKLYQDECLKEYRDGVVRLAVTSTIEFSATKEARIEELENHLLEIRNICNDSNISWDETGLEIDAYLSKHNL